MKTIIIPVSYGSTFKNSASERIRCDWLLPYLPSDKYNESQKLDDYDVIIYQKGYRPGLAQHYNGKKIQILDMTDPIWYACPVKRLNAMYDYIDIFIFPTPELCENFKIFFPDKANRAFTVIDRLELSCFPKQKVHVDRKPIFVWFGYADNFLRVSPLLPYIKDYELIVICERSIGIGRWIKWEEATVNDSIMEGDIVLNPLCYNCLKTSRNKTITAWALGMPVVQNKSIDDALLDIGLYAKLHNNLFNRRQEAQIRLNQVGEYYDIKQSAQEIRDIIDVLI